jgi:dTDP-4-amino-4,6-dideoxygalactose transaminase
VAQCEKLDEILTRRVALAARMREAVDLRWQRAPAGAVVNHQTLGFTIPHSSPGDLAGLRARRDAVIAALRADGVEAGILSYALHRLPAFAAHAVNAARSFPVADAVVDGGVAAPLHPRMTEADADAVIAALRRHAGGAR